MPPETIHFTVFGVPEAKRRPRVAVCAGHARAYSEQKTVDAERSFLAQALPHKPEEPLTGPLSVELEFFFVPPKSWSKKRKQAAISNEEFPCEQRRDLDNLAKHVLDALNGVFYLDDRQIVSLFLTKTYSQMARTVVFIKSVGEKP